MGMETHRWNPGFVAGGSHLLPRRQQNLCLCHSRWSTHSVANTNDHTASNTYADSYCESNVNATCYSNTNKYAICVYDKDCPPVVGARQVGMGNSCQGRLETRLHAGAVWQCRATATTLLRLVLVISDSRSNAGMTCYDSRNTGI